MRILLILIGCVCLVGGWQIAGAKQLATVGKVYPLAEPDALAEIRTAAQAVDWEKALDREKIMGQLQRYRPPGLSSLPAAGENRVFQVAMDYTLDHDLPDGKGGVLYPQGYTFNPLEYVSLRSVLVVIDGGDPRQVAWFKEWPQAQDFRTRLLLTGGDYTELAKELKRPVFYLQTKVAKRLQLAAVPSVVRQQGKKLEITEFLVPHE